MALTELNNRVTERVRRELVLEETRKGLVAVRGTLTKFLEKNGDVEQHYRKDTPMFGYDLGKVTYRGNWENKELNVTISQMTHRIFPKGITPLTVDVELDGYCDKYLMPKRVMNSSVIRYDQGSQIIQKKGPEECLGLGEVVAAIQSGQLVMVKE